MSKMKLSFLLCFSLCFQKRCRLVIMYKNVSGAYTNQEAIFISRTIAIMCKGSKESVGTTEKKMTNENNSPQLGKE